MYCGPRKAPIKGKNQNDKDGFCARKPGLQTHETPGGKIRKNVYREVIQGLVLTMMGSAVGLGFRKQNCNIKLAKPYK